MRAAKPKTPGLLDLVPALADAERRLGVYLVDVARGGDATPDAIWGAVVGGPPRQVETSDLGLVRVLLANLVGAIANPAQVEPVRPLRVRPEAGN